MHAHQARPLSEFCQPVASAFYPAATALYESGDVPFARCMDCINYPVISKVQEDEFERIPRWFVEKSGQIHCVGKGDIILTKVGTPCFASVVDDYEEIALSRTVLGLTNIHGVNPYYLTAFLRSRFGFQQLMRERELTIQYQLTLERVRKVLIYQASSSLQQAIEAIMRCQVAELQRAKDQAERAEKLLLQALGLDGWSPPEPLTYTRPALEVFPFRRLDAEHFQPKFDEMLRITQDQGFPLVPLGELIFPVKNGYDCRDFVEDGTPYIRVGDISQCRINLELAERVAITLEQIRKDIKLQIGDVLFTRKGSFGNAAPVREGQEHAIISSEIMLIRCRPEYKRQILPEFLALFFNSLAGELQAEKWAHGVAFFSISQDDLNRFLVPVLPLPKQISIQQLLEDSDLARRQAGILLERGTRAVEVAIKESEEAAMRFLKETEK